MNIQPVSATYFAHAMERAASLRHISPAAPADSADPVHISSAARAALAAEGDASVEAKLASIRARGPINRSEADQAYLFTHDQRLAEIAAQASRPKSSPRTNWTTGHRDEEHHGQSQPGRKGAV
jgi:hypothetical protein